MTSAVKMYRLNFGNGQVSRTYTQKKNAIGELNSRQAQEGFALSFIQRYIGDGEWERVDARSTASKLGGSATARDAEGERQ